MRHRSWNINAGLPLCEYEESWKAAKTEFHILKSGFREKVNETTVFETIEMT